MGVCLTRKQWKIYTMVLEHADKFLPKKMKEEGVMMGKLIMKEEDAEVSRRMQTRKW